MKSKGYIKYLKKQKKINILVLITQILIVVSFITIWQILASKGKIVDRNFYGHTL